MQKTFEMEQEAQKKRQSIQRGFDEEMIALKNRSSDEMAAVKRQHERQVEQLKQEIHNLDVNLNAYKRQLLMNKSLDKSGSEVCRTT